MLLRYVSETEEGEEFCSEKMNSFYMLLKELQTSTVTVPKHADKFRSNSV